MGLVRAGLEQVGVRTVYANDICPTKAKLYRSNWGTDALVQDDIRNVSAADIPDVEIATASFPCIDTSVAGKRAGLEGEQSGLINEFVRILTESGKRIPKAVIVENVPGFRTVNGGRDFALVVSRLESLGYSVADVAVDAAAFVPQSRARVFLLGTQGEAPAVPDPPRETTSLRLVDVASTDSPWWPRRRRDDALASLSPLQRARVNQWQADSSVRYFGAFRRTRNGRPVWEIRSDQIAGTLRTLSGGSARQAIARIGAGRFDMRWMVLDEYARLQGAEGLRYDAVSERQAMYALGDAVCVPVMKWIGDNWVKRLTA